MLKFRRQNYRFALRAVIFFGVFGGLLISSGEGIRLFPFSDSSRAPSAPGKAVSEKRFSSYAVSTHGRTVGSIIKSGTKFQKDTEKLFIAAAVNFAWQNAPADFYVVRARADEAVLTVPQRRRTPLSGRAPPSFV